MTAVPRKEVTTRQVASIRFGVLTDDEVHKISVKRITNPITYDNANNIVPDGLYDPALGPVDFTGRCATCHLGNTECPGHFGHIELPLPVYNPLLFNTMYKLLRNTCLHCHHFKLARPEMEKFIEKFECLARGDLVGASAVQIMGMLKGKSAEDVLGLAGEAQEAGGSKEGYEASPGKAAAAGGQQLPTTCHVQEARRAAVGEFFKRIPPTRCDNCGAQNPKIKKQGCSKIFQEYSRKQLLTNHMRGITSLADAVRVAGSEAAAGSAEGGVGQKRKRQQGGSAAAAAESKDARDNKEGLAAGPKEKEGEELMEVDEVAEIEALQDEGPPAKKGRGGAGKGAAMLPQLEIDESSLVRYLNPQEVQQHVQQLCAKEAPILTHLYGCLVEVSPKAVTAVTPGVRTRDLLNGTPQVAAAPGQLHKIFFIRALAVAPNKFRPPSVLGDQRFEHSQNVVMQRVINTALMLQSSQQLSAQRQQQQQQGGDATTAAAAAEDGLAGLSRGEELARFTNIWLRLQNEVNSLIDSTTADNSETPGIRQQLEKKEGLFRKHMMGKRVNYAARSVISPDPYIGTGEIGVPPYFAVRLSFPEPVTPWNVGRLRQMVINGPSVHPGAVAVEDHRGQLIQLARLDRKKREGLAKQLMVAAPTRSPASAAAAGGTGALAAAGGPRRGFVVYRHLLDGDLMLTNRQPTLHKPGLMAHKARVLKGERTIRMHYANCSTFNADFDGDEINLHLPQDQLGRAEGYGIVHADQQFIVPTDGKPIRGLIQDHVIAGVLITKRDSFFTKAEFCQLLYNSCRAWSAAKVEDLVLSLPVPALIKPRVLWTGKQLLSALVSHFTRSQPPLSFSSGSKVPTDYWGRSSDEGTFTFHKGELVTGCLDKAQFGKYGLVHAVQELYGNSVAGELLSALSRLGTLYLQWHGFTCGMNDLLLVPAAEQARVDVLGRAECTALRASAEVAKCWEPSTYFVAEKVASGEWGAAGVARSKRALMWLDANRKEVAAKLGDEYREDWNTLGARHDSKVSGVMHPLSSEVLKACIPAGQQKPFPHNCMSLMTVSGAKGSLVNFSQIACLLGQQELEGRRVPRMASGKTLPCFRPFDGGARSGGFVGDRFLTGLRPQEYYFHCMAGREGLVDTAVKTSRSGYLQRCLVKNLEALKVAYDSTVRDVCDGSVVQFQYGEDGLDVTQVSYLKQYGFMARNAAAGALRMGLPPPATTTSSSNGQPPSVSDAVAALLARAHLEDQAVVKYLRKRTKLLRKALKGGSEAAQQLLTGLPLNAEYSMAQLGVTSEAFQDGLLKYCIQNPDRLLLEGAGEQQQQQDQQQGSSKKHKKQQQQQALTSPRAGLMSEEEFTTLMQLKFMASLAAPGEAVGVLAAQSVGEPSTQMTLNTFHMAGRGEANVTLGIPRLREILMTAAPRIKTPTMTVPLLVEAGPGAGAALSSALRKLRLAECLRGLRVREQPVVRVSSDTSGDGSCWARRYTVQLRFYPMEQYPKEARLSWPLLAHAFEKKFCPELHAAINKLLKKAGGEGIGMFSATAAAADMQEAAEDEMDEGGEGGGSNRSKAKAAKEAPPEDYEEDEELREGKLRFRGGRGEAATYDEPDEEDAEVAAAVDRQMQQREDDGLEEEQQQQGAAASGKGAGKRGGAAKAKAGKAAAAAAAAAAGGKGKAAAAAVAAALAKAPSSGSSKGQKGLAGVMLDRRSGVCQYQLTLPLSSPKLLLLELVEETAARVVVRAVPGIEKVHLLDPEKGSSVPRLQTEGINFSGLWQQAHLADVHAISCNDVYAMLTTYGVEAARATILREVSSVFGAYGIGVDSRHLSLIADFMTHQGGYRACNRIGIDSSTSPLLKMSFETAAMFLTTSSLKGEVDPLRSPAARLCLGLPTEVGTGSFQLLQPLLQA